MTQDELDALMAGDLDDEISQLEEESECNEGVCDEASLDDIENLPQGIDLNNTWPPPAPTHEHKVVDQLDDVTRDSEAKASEIFDKLEEISSGVGSVEDDTNGLVATLENNITLFEKLCVKFPNVESFQTALAENQEALNLANGIIEKSQNSADEIMVIMDIMQYQDIHRQKIERVINVMRALSKYMQSLFESEKEDSARVKAPNHIEGDAKESVSADEIEALLASFGKK